MTGLDNVFQAVEDAGSTIDLSTMYPGPGTYCVTSQEVHGGFNQNEQPYIRVELMVDKHAQANEREDANGKRIPNKLEGSTFSIFFNVDPSEDEQTKLSPLNFACRRLYMLFNDRWPNEASMSTVSFREWVGQLDGGYRFVLHREVNKTKKGIFPKDTLISLAAYKKAQEVAGEQLPAMADIKAALTDF